ncbi:hypothetical protein GGI09_003764, partial [Coemansia sp. S100]
MRHQLQLPSYLIKLCVGPVADTAVACLAVLCLLTSKHSWRGMADKRPLTAAASFANVALLLSTTVGVSGRSTVSVAAALALSLCSAASVSHGNLQACLHIVRALNTAFDSSLLSLHIAATSALIHLLVAWQLLRAETKAHAIRCLRDMFGIRGFDLIMLGKRRQFTVEDIRDPTAEEDLCRKCKLVCNDRAKSGQELNMTEVGLLLAVWQLLVLMAPIRRYFLTVEDRFSKRRRALINSKLLVVYAFSRRKNDNLYWAQSKARELVGASESFMSIISMTLAQTLNAWVTASQIGWRALVPIVVAFVHWLLSRLVARKIERLYEQNYFYPAPKFLDDFTGMLHNIRTVKFYAWEDVFSKGYSSTRFEDYEPPMVWRMLRFGLDLL